MPGTSRRTAAFFVALALAGCAASPPPRPQKLQARDYSYAKARLQWLVREQMAAHDIVGLSIVVVDDQEVVLQQGFGYADRDAKVPVAPDTVFQAGSVSKLFTATALMQLVEQGRVDLDRPLQEHLPEFSIRSRMPGAPAVTLRRVLTHHAGLPSDRLADFIWRDSAPADHDRIFMSLPGQLADEYLAARPGDVFAYSNLGFSLAGAVVARVSGEGFSDRVASSLLAPLGMQDTSFARTPAIAAKLSRGYDGDGELQAAARIRDVPAGELYTSAADLGRFMKMVLAGGRVGDKQVIGADTLKQMLTPQNEDAALDDAFRIGLAWWLPPTRATELNYAAHGGDLPPFHSMLAVLPEEKIGVAILANSDGAQVVAGDLLLTALRLAVEAKTGVAPPEKKPNRVELPEQKVAGLEGVYSSMLGTMTIERSGSTLTATLGGIPVRLVPRDDGTFGLQYRLLGLVPLPIAMLEPMSISFHEANGRKLYSLYMGTVLAGLGERLDRVELASVPKTWRDRLGRYEVTNPGATPMLDDVELAFDEDSGQLVVAMDLALFGGRRIAFPVQPAGETELVTRGVGRNAGDTLRVVREGGEERLHYSGYVLRRTAE